MCDIGLRLSDVCISHKVDCNPKGYEGLQEKTHSSWGFYDSQTGRASQVTPLDPFSPRFCSDPGVGPHSCYACRTTMFIEDSLTGLDPAPTYSLVQWETQGYVVLVKRLDLLEKKRVILGHKCSQQLQDASTHEAMLHVSMLLIVKLADVLRIVNPLLLWMAIKKQVGHIFKRNFEWMEKDNQLQDSSTHEAMLEASMPGIVGLAVVLRNVNPHLLWKAVQNKRGGENSWRGKISSQDKEVFLKLGSLFGSASVTSAELSGVQSAASLSIGSGQTWQFPGSLYSQSLEHIPHEFFGKGDRMVQVKGKVQDQHFSVMIVMSLPITQAIPCIANDPSKKTQHMFNDIIHSIIYMDADVITTENSRSDEKLSSAFCEGVKHDAGFGHGVHDIHSLTKDSTNRRNC
ncbi:hypothetical protein VNO77_21842 [Canavalia gladiata]|uniref:Cobalamin-independent methionine synthase MetE C-terminal/archaeal domain-containing protein n=1 Tax=Canavalia gladiata TaxID=3824 RepID=A0AAN9QA89_CANGL